ncbi:OPT family small oligopeptide transporter [Apiospora arundinis]
MFKSNVLVILSYAAGLALGSPVADPPQITTITVIPQPPPAEPTTTPCPTVTNKAICPTCTQLACAKISTIYEGLPGCPSPVPTLIWDYFCGGACPPPECTTIYTYPSRTTSASPAAITTTF